MNPVIEAVDQGHYPQGWTNRVTLAQQPMEVPGPCRACHTDWPCEVIRYARAKNSEEDRQRLRKSAQSMRP